MCARMLLCMATTTRLLESIGSREPGVHWFSWFDYRIFLNVANLLSLGIRPNLFIWTRVCNSAIDTKAPTRTRKSAKKTQQLAPEAIQNSIIWTHTCCCQSQVVAWWTSLYFFTKRNKEHKHFVICSLPFNCRSRPKCSWQALVCSDYGKIFFHEVTKFWKAWCTDHLF